VKTSRAADEHAAAHDGEMPIAEQGIAVLYEGKHAADLVPALMQRQQKAELHGIVAHQ
jgi:glycerol-3-phosphate dehydrogenase